MNYPTTYSYDALGNLWTVSQSGQSRGFTYNSLSQLLTATNPESGQVQYSYDADGNVISKTDARGITTTYAYDALNRVLYKTYSDTSTVRACYAYDGLYGWGDSMTNPVGHLTSSWGVQHDGTVVSANESYQFDPMGRVQAGRQCTPATCGLTSYPLSATYNLVGNETSFSDSSVTRSTTYDSADRMQTFTGNFPGIGNQNLLVPTSNGYGPVGMVQATLGSGSGALTETRAYNNRTWLQSLSVSNSVYSLGLTYAGNGNVLTANDSQNGNWSYTYDNVNRLQTATTTGQSFTYYPDPYGNMYCSNSGNLPCTLMHGTPPNLNLSFNTANNQISDGGIHQYDSAGNMTADGTHGYVYDAENRITCVLGTDGTCTSVSAMLYLYDPDGQRVGKQQANTLEDYVYDPQGHIISVHDGSANLLRTDLYAGGRHVATWAPNPNGQYSDPFPSGLFYNHTDWLGTERVRTDINGNIAQTCTDTPYGMNLNCVTTQGDTSPMHFTGKQRDSESNLDYFGARYFGGGNSLGRFMTPDWSSVPQPVPFASLGNPQTLNLYSYVGNNPLSVTDPYGHNWFIDFFKGLANATYRPLLMMIEHPIITGRAIGYSAGHPVATYHALRKSTVTTTQRVIAGNGTAIGTVVGTVGMALIPGAGEVGDAGEVVEGAAEAGEAAEAAEAADEAAEAAEATETTVAETPKPDIRPTVAEKNTPEGAQEQLESIEHAQKIKPNSIQDVSKSRQRFKTAVRKWLTGSSDLEPKD